MFSTFTKFYHKASNEKNLSIMCIHRDHGTEFENQQFENFCNEKGIEHSFSVPMISQQNGIVEKKIML